jgi:UDP-N-acetylglucosamine--N-acetylmuramyl-(pentapeptide) pyrophosphoryl-undecaprenol N-acetylglucosamine transferase
LRYRQAVSSPRILVAAGGAGGHVSAAVAVAEALRDRGARPCLVVEDGPGVAGRAMAARLAPWCDRVVVAESGIPRGRGRVRRQLAVPPRLAAATAQLMATMTRVRPAAVVLLGGAVCAPLAAMARVGGARVVVHEQNAVMGLANRVASSMADVVGDAFAVADRRVPVPVRTAFVPRAVAASGRSPRVLVVGGSGGSAALDDALRDASPRLAAAGVTGVQAGPTSMVPPPGFTVVPFIDDMARAMADADVIVTAAGAVSLAEAGRVGRACVVLPRRDVAADHQRANTDALQARGAIVATTATTLADDVIDLCGDRARREAVAAALSQWAAGDGAGWLADRALG